MENKDNVDSIDNTSHKKLNKNTVHKSKTVSDREIMTVIKEEKRFPVAFSSRIKLSVLIKYYNKYWNIDFTDESDTDSKQLYKELKLIY